LTRDRDPLDWAKTQELLGTTLLVLNERGSRAGKLQDAEDAFREALKEYTFEKFPRLHNIVRQKLINIELPRRAV
jgi:hypothetical protein